MAAPGEVRGLLILKCPALSALGRALSKSHISRIHEAQRRDYLESIVHLHYEAQEDSNMVEYGAPLKQFVNATQENKSNLV